MPGSNIIDKRLINTHDDVNLTSTKPWYCLFQPCIIKKYDFNNLSRICLKFDNKLNAALSISMNVILLCRGKKVYKNVHAKHLNKNIKNKIFIKHLYWQAYH